MKKQLLFLILVGFITQGCFNYILVRRTVSKTITLTFNINSTGAFNSVSTITPDQITNLFDPDIFTNSQSQIERFDLKTFDIQGIVNPQQNTATEVTVKADITSGTPMPLFKQTKLILMTNNQWLQDVKDIFNASTGNVDKGLSIANAILALKAEGVGKIQQTINDNLKGFNQTPLNIMLTGSAPAGQRVVGQIIITMEASITYSRCEKWTDFPFPLDVDKC